MEIRGSNTGGKLGAPLKQENIENLSNEQIVQLYELMKEATQTTKELPKE